MDKIKFVALGGLDEDGKNCYCIEINDDIFVIEAGLKYPPLNMPGIDYIIPDDNYLVTNKDRVKAFIISHGHLDQFGALYKFAEDVKVPIYTSKIASEMIKFHYKKAFNKQCPFNIKIIETNSDVMIGKRKFSFFSTTHSVAQSFGFAIDTDLGSIIYSGDFISDFDEINDYSFNLRKVALISQEKPTFLLLSESQGADLNGVCSPNHKLTPHISQYFKNAEGKIFVALYEQNLFNLTEIINQCLENNKKICFIDSNYEDFILNLGNYSDTLKFPIINLVRFKQTLSVNQNQIVYILTGSGQELFDTIKNVCQHQIKGIEVTENDTFIVAAPSVPGTELNHTQAIDTIYETDCKVVNISRKQLNSMHAHKEDLKMLLALTKPRYYLPIKGEYRKLMDNAKIAMEMNIGLNYMNIFILDNGDQIFFSTDGSVSSKTNKINTTDVMVDGLSVGEVKDMIISERQKMAEDGVVMLGIAISLANKKIVTQTDIQMRGCLYLKDSQDVIDTLTSLFVNTVKDSFETCKKAEEIELKVYEVIRKYMRKTLSKEPIISVSVIDLDRVKIL